MEATLSGGHELISDIYEKGLGQTIEVTDISIAH